MPFWNRRPTRRQAIAILIRLRSWTARSPQKNPLEWAEMRTMSLAPQQVASGKHTKLAIQNIANQPDTLQTIKFFAGERRYSHSYQKD